MFALNHKYSVTSNTPSFARDVLAAAGQTSSKMSDEFFIKRAFEHAQTPTTINLYCTTHMFCSRCHRQSQQDCKHFLGRRRRQSAVLLHWRLTFDAVKCERELISKIRARHEMRNDETFSAIAGRTDEREACEQEVVHQKGGHDNRLGPALVRLSEYSAELQYSTLKPYVV